MPPRSSNNKRAGKFPRRQDLPLPPRNIKVSFLRQHRGDRFPVPKGHFAKHEVPNRFILANLPEKGKKVKETFIMAFIEPNPVQATEKAGGKGTVTIVHLLTEKELDGKCGMFSKVIIPPCCSLGVHEHHGDVPHPLRHGALQRQRPRGHAPRGRDDVLRRRREARHRERVEDGGSRLHGADHQQVR